MNYKAEICKIGKMMEEKGYVDYFEGNISILDRETNKLYITPTQTRKLTLTEDEVAVLDFDTEEQRLRESARHSDGSTKQMGRSAIPHSPHGPCG